MGKNTDFQAHILSAQPPTVWSWAIYLVALCLSSLARRMKVTIVLISWSCCEDTFLPAYSELELSGNIVPLATVPTND